MHNHRSADTTSGGRHGPLMCCLAPATQRPPKPGFGLSRNASLLINFCWLVAVQPTRSGSIGCWKTNCWNSRGATAKQGGTQKRSFRTRFRQRVAQSRLGTRACNGDPRQYPCQKTSPRPSPRKGLSCKSLLRPYCQTFLPHATSVTHSDTRAYLWPSVRSAVQAAVSWTRRTSQVAQVRS